ncbi:hypothetical protein EBR44_06285 [bacterium]|jgi:hypothetical protein|nr:hypothetical protein [bacterium]
MNPAVIAEDAALRLHEAADLCDRARAEAEASDEQLALSLEQAASVIESISPTAIPTGTSTRQRVDEACARALKSHAALLTTIAERMQSIRRELGQLSQGVSATSGYTTRPAASRALVVDRIG